MDDGLLVAICTFNRSPLLAKALRSLAVQDAPPTFPILVVDNASTDDTAAVVAEFQKTLPNLSYVLETRRGLSNARNRALADCREPLIAYLDDDAIASPGWVRAMTGAFAELGPDVAAIGGRILPIWEAPKPDWFSAELEDYVSVLDFGDATMVLADRGVVGANMAFRTEALRAGGGFSDKLGRKGKRLLGNEELAVVRNLRARGLAIGYCGAAVVDHLVPKDRMTHAWILDRFKQQGVSDAILLLRIEGDLRAFIDRSRYAFREGFLTKGAPDFVRRRHRTYLHGAALGALFG